MIRRLLVLSILAFVIAAPSALAAESTALVSVSTGGMPGDYDSGGSGLALGTRSEVSVSGDGRFVAFESDAGTLAAGDSNNRADVFVRDRDTDGDGVFDEAGAVSTTLASVGTDGRQQTGQLSRSAVLSRDGRYLAFMSYASLEDADTNGAGDVYVRDLVARTTTRVSVGTAGKQGDNGSTSPAMSPDGRYVAYSSIATTLDPQDTDNLEDVYLRDRDTDADGVMDEPGSVKTTLVSVGSDEKKELTTNEFPTVSADGRFVAFTTLADEWVPGDANRANDVYVRDLVAGTTARLSIGLGGADANQESQEPSISDSGRYVAFSSQASNLVPGDTNEARDVFVVDRDPDADGSFDEPGNLIGRLSVASDESQAQGRSSGPSISPDGKVVVFESEAGGLGPDSVHPDIYIRHRDADADGRFDEPGESSTSLVNLSRENGPADASSWSPVISADLRWVAFSSFASNYVAGDANNKFDVFVRGPIPDPFVGAGPGAPAGTAAISPKPAKLRRLVKGLSVAFTAPGPGALALRATVPARRLGRKGAAPVLVAKGRVTVQTAGPGRVALTVTRAGRTLAGRGRASTLALRGTFTSAGGPAQPLTGSLRLTR